MSDIDFLEVNYIDVVMYVNCASDLAEAIQKDLKNSKRAYSSATMVALAKFIKSAEAIQKTLDMIRKDGIELN